VTAVAVIFAVN